MNKISVIISIYKYQKYGVLKTVLTSLVNQKNVPEIIISEQGYRTDCTIQKMVKSYNCRFILSSPDCFNGKGFFNPGRVRNIGASISSGDILYFSDADICFIDKNYFEYLEKLYSSDINQNWYHPMMYRLSENNVASFCKNYQLNQTIQFPDPKYCLIDFDSKSKLIPSQKGEFQAIVNHQPHMSYVSDYKTNPTTDFDYRRIEKYSWKPEFHYGGVACTRRDFFKVGGYCEKFLNWGMEDSDFQWKLSCISLLKTIINIRKRQIIHFEHRSRCKNSIYIRNRKIYEKRLGLGINKVIEKDLLKNTSNFHNRYINKNYINLYRCYE